MSVKLRTWIDKWDKVVLLAGVALTLITIIITTSRSSGRSEQSLIDIRVEQGKQEKSFSEFKSETKANKETQDAFNKGVTEALNKIINNANITASYLRAYAVDHDGLMRLHPQIRPKNPIDFNQEKIKPPEPEKIQQTYNGKMQPFPQ